MSTAVVTVSTAVVHGRAESARATAYRGNPPAGIPLVTVTFAVSSPGIRSPSQLRWKARIDPVDGSVNTAIAGSPSRVTVYSPSGPVSTNRSSVVAHSGS